MPAPASREGTRESHRFACPAAATHQRQPGAPAEELESQSQVRRDGWQQPRGTAWGVTKEPWPEVGALPWGGGLLCAHPFQPRTKLRAVRPPLPIQWEYRERRLHREVRAGEAELSLQFVTCWLRKPRALRMQGRSQVSWAPLLSRDLSPGLRPVPVPVLVIRG